MNKKASDMLNIMCIEKKAGIVGDAIETVKNVAKKGAGVGAETAKDTLTDVKRATGIEKFVPKHNVGDNALKGAGVGALAGAANGIATNTGEKKDNFGAAIKGGLTGAVGGAVLGGAGSHVLNKKDAEAFHAANGAFKRGVGVGAVAGGTAGAIGKDGVENGFENLKKHIPADVKERATKLYDKTKSTVGSAFDKSSDALSSAKKKTDGFIDSVGKKVDKINNKLNGHVGYPPRD